MREGARGRLSLGGCGHNARRSASKRSTPASRADGQKQASGVGTPVRNPPMAGTTHNAHDIPPRRTRRPRKRPAQAPGPHQTGPPPSQHVASCQRTRPHAPRSPASRRHRPLQRRAPRLRAVQRLPAPAVVSRAFLRSRFFWLADFLKPSSSSLAALDGAGGGAVRCGGGAALGPPSSGATMAPGMRGFCAATGAAARGAGMPCRPPCCGAPYCCAGATGCGA